jgi:hypothetical protein
MYKLAFLAMIVGLSTGTLAFADVSDLSTLYLIEAGGVGGGDIMRAGTFSASGKTASGFPTKSGPEVSVSGSGKQTGSSSDDTATENRAGMCRLRDPRPAQTCLFPFSFQETMASPLLGREHRLPESGQASRPASTVLLGLFLVGSSVALRPLFLRAADQAGSH